MNLKRKIFRVLYTGLLAMIVISCSQNEGMDEWLAEETSGSEWLVDTTMMTGTKVRDVFPLVTQPIFVAVKDAPRRSLSDKAVVFKLDETIFIFPYWIMGVEVVNGNFNNTHFAVTYCPKTKTTYVFNREINGELHTFKASGLLYQDNLVFYDLETESLWSQMYFKCIHGEHFRKVPEMFHSFETTYDNALHQFPDAKVFVDYPGAGNTFQSSLKSAPQSGDMVLGLLDHVLKPGDLSVVNFNELNNTGLINLGTNIVVYHKEYRYIDAFLVPPGITFESSGNFPGILTDNEGNTWDVFGKSVSGPRKGEQLSGVTSFLAYWWAWEGIYSSFNFIN